jgi:hypothetical protein
LDIRKGDHALVNVAPFIGSLRRNRQSVACEILAVRGDDIEVRTLPPCRECCLQVKRLWIDRVLEPTSV